MQHFTLLATRLDWFNMGSGLGSNKTGVLIAILIISSWLFAFSKDKRALFVSILCSGALSYFLLLTESRGALLGLGVGFIALIALGKFKFTKLELISIISIALAVFAYGLISGKADRYFQGFEDGSIQARFKLWDASIDMMADAPGGWGIGNSGQAFMQWYQPYWDDEIYITLVNSHLSRLVELPWIMRLLYLLLIAVALAIIYPKPRHALLIVGFAIWLVFLIGGFFNPIDDFWIIWLIPLTFFLLAIKYRWQKKEWAIKWQLIAFAASALLLLSGLYAATLFRDGRGYPLSGAAYYVKLGEGKPRLTLYKPDSRVLEYQYGHDIRKNMEQLECLEVVYDQSKATCAEILMLTGGNLDYPKTWKPKRVVIINPECDALLNLLTEREIANAELYAGRYLNWKQLKCIKQSAEKYDIKLSIHPGAGGYYQGWLDIVCN